MPGSNPLYYWDACLFLAWLKDEQRKAGAMDGVRDIIQRMKRRDVKVMTSVLTIVEVLSAKIPVGMDTLFKDLMKRLNRQGMDIRVASIAHDLRNYYAMSGERMLKSPDAIHLATAILYRADEFHTFDDQLSLEMWEAIGSSYASQRQKVLNSICESQIRTNLSVCQPRKRP